MMHVVQNSWNYTVVEKNPDRNKKCAEILTDMPLTNVAGAGINRAKRVSTKLGGLAAGRQALLHVVWGGTPEKS